MRNLFALAGVALLGACSSPPPPGYVQVNDAYVAKLPPQPITAVIGYGQGRVSVQVDSVAGCVAASRNLEASAAEGGAGAGSIMDNFADCIDREGNIVLVVNAGTLYKKTKAAAPGG